MRDDPQVTELVTRARNGDQQAWDALVERYSPLIWSLCCRCQLSGTDAEDVSQTVWLRLVDQLGNLRDPAALPGWIVTTVRRECYRPVPYAEISARLGMPVGSIGPTRRRCLDKLRRDPAIAALIDAEAASADAIHDYLVAR
jgi:DNA-directed RNA polymerase specialized sigma24 family protein